MTVTKPESSSTSPLVALLWSLSAVVSLLAVIVWGQSLGWHFQNLSAYALFPVLGLIAFSIMWTHYVADFMRRTFLKHVELHAFFEWTGYIVLVMIVLHPSILIHQRFKDGFGLPPGSYESYVAPSMAWITLLGTASLLIFLAFELRRWFHKKNWWKYVLALNDVAMLAIFYHGLRLGTQTHIAWFRYVWWFYGVVLVAVLAHKYIVRIQQHSLDSR